ncbi:hypothetical protein DID88_008871 [Monilinia fructigena]|uniref:Uncharacterized protein n=1 Tax=Monilinia fructigena TaxID=38457 RepID=A0A395J752_9HELO|nr:hypothetical protein DID88_008871 [Monilinia fructigena]
MDYDNLTVKELLERFSDRGLSKPTFKEGLIALLENHDLYLRKQEQVEELAVIGQEIVEGRSDIKTLLTRTMNNLLAGLKLRLPKLPMGIDAIMKVNMQVTHVREEVIGIDDPEQDQVQEGHSQSQEEEAQEDTDAVILEEEDDTPAQLQPSKEISKENLDKTGSLKRKAPSPENISQGQTITVSAPKAKSTASKKPWKKQKRIGGRFAPKDAPLADK